MFKKLLRELLEARTVEDIDHIFYRFPDGIDLSYQHEKLTWKDYELLCAIMLKCTEAVKWEAEHRDSK